MKVLAIDTSGPNCSVAVLDEQKVIGSFTINIGKTHSETLLPLVDELLKFIGLELSEIDIFACCIGPGSFTGIRIGISTIKGFALSLNKPVISISALEGLAYNVTHFDGIICSILNANNNNVYSALYKLEGYPKMTEDYFTDSIDSLIEEIKKKKEKVLFIGDGAIAYKEKIQNKLSEQAIFVSHHLNEQSSVSIARAALYKYSKGDVGDAFNIQPLYLRKSQAERLMEQQ